MQYDKNTNKSNIFSERNKPAILAPNILVPNDILCVRYMV